ncbi:hypothetical protein BGX34_007659 [Mortierella sp. NVP85]|nr:hypothetical protein BGX34_007659 [Mortierella sp. NVP85]
MESVTSFTSGSTGNDTPNMTTTSLNSAPSRSISTLQRQAVHKSAAKEHQKHSKKHIPLFPTDRTKGAGLAGATRNVLRPVDISKIDLMPIEYTHKIIMTCIEEIKLRGLKQPHLFRNPFYSPSVEGLLKLFKDPSKHHLFTVKMMRIDTVGGLLTTALSRTYPPLIPPHIQEMFRNPEGRYFFELLNMLPELNRFLFVEILDLCCDLVDNQIYNHLSHSKLSVYPGSCCFGMDEYMPTWDTRYLLTAEIKKTSNTFYHIIYAYREERDLTREQLQQKLDDRDRILKEQRLEALEREFGLEGAHNILKREARIARGLPPDSPEVAPLPSDERHISLYEGRMERVVADDAISVLEIQLDDPEAPAAVVPRRPRSASNAEDTVEGIMADLRRSTSVAAMERYSAATKTARTIAVRVVNYSYYRAPVRSAPGRFANAPIRPRGNVVRAKSIARSGSLVRNTYPVSPGDIFGISQNAKEQRELQDFLSVARTIKKRKSISSKRITRMRSQNKVMRQSSIRSTSSSDSGSVTSSPIRRTAAALPLCVARRQQSMALSQLKTSAAANLRRERTRKLRKEIEVYQTKGLTVEEALQQREIDMKKQRRREKRARAAARAQAEAEAQAAALRSAEGITMEEAEILEAFDYLTDREFKEFIALAGLTMQDVERIRERASAAALSQVTKDIQSADAKVKTFSAETNRKVDSPENAPMAFGSAYSTDSEPTAWEKRRPTSIPHMTSMDILMKNAKVIGDGDLRCYPMPPSPAKSGRAQAAVLAQQDNLSEKAQMERILQERQQARMSVESTASIETIVSPVEPHYSQPSTMPSTPASAPQKTFETSPVYMEQDYEDDIVEDQMNTMNDNDDASEDEELRELLESMTEAERKEFMRLSHYDTLLPNLESNTAYAGEY